MRSAPSAPYSHTIPFRLASRGRAESAYSLPKDRCDCQRSRPLPDRHATRGAASDRQRAAPHRCGAKELVPKGTGSGICSRTALHFRRPGTTPEGIIDQTGRSNRSAAGGLT
jgi:hypothetical protein